MAGVRVEEPRSIEQESSESLRNQRILLIIFVNFPHVRDARAD